MEKRILAIDFEIDKYEIAQKEWLKYNTYLRMVLSMREAIEELAKKNDYIMIVICAQDSGYLEWLHALRSATINPILIMKPEYDGNEKIRAIELGADEYITRPSTVEESVASCRALLRRYMEYCSNAEWCATKYVAQDVFMCLHERQVFVRGKKIELTKIEFELLRTLLSNRKHIFTFELLYEMVWGEDYTESSKKALSAHIKRLRRKLKVEDDVPDYIKNIHDYGYKFDVD